MSELRTLGQEEQYRLHPPIDVGLFSQVQLGEYGVDVLLHPRSDSANVPAIAASDFPCAISPSTSGSSRSEERHHAAGRTSPRGKKLVDDLGVDDRAPTRDRSNRRDQLIGVGHSILQQVGPAIGALVEQGDRVAALACWLRTTTPVLGRGDGSRPPHGCPRRYRSAACGCR